MKSYDVIIERKLREAKKLPEGKNGVAGAELNNGYTLRIEYHTEGKCNVCDSWREVTSEAWDWERAGCKNNEEWRAHLNRLLGRDHRAGLQNKNLNTKSSC